MRTLETLLPLAIRAHAGRSFSPEKRGEQAVNEYSKLLEADLEQIKEAKQEDRDRYAQRFVKYLTAYLGVSSRIVSPMIAGPSNFPVRQQQKYHNWEDNAYKRFSEFREKALKGIGKQIERDKPQEQKDTEVWEKIRKNILSSVSTIVGIDRGDERCRGYARPLFVNSITGLVKRMAKNGQAEHVRKALELIRELNKQCKKPIVTEKNAIFSLVEIAGEIKADKEHEAGRESEVFEFEGGKVILNYGLNRLQIQHDKKPPFEVLANLKANGFKWSPREVAWQRFLTNESKYKATQLTGIQF